MIAIDRKAMEEMISDGTSSYPDECCGFMFGTEQGESRNVTAIMPVVNAKEGDRRRRFLILPRDYMAAERFAEKMDLLLLGVYHSHPNHPAVPSEHDRVAAQPYFSYAILSIMEGKFSELRSWRLDEEQQFREEKANIHQLL